MVLVAVPQLALSWARLGRHWQLQEEAEKWWRGEQEEGDSRHSHLDILDIVCNCLDIADKVQKYLDIVDIVHKYTWIL